jgi:DNA-binding transcriptional ArsR family regulator
MSKYEKQHYDEASRVMKALSHPIRLQILIHLMKQECNVSSLEKTVGFSQSGISQHLRILRLSRIIEPKRIGKEICYKIIHNKAIQIVKCIMDEK